MYRLVSAVMRRSRIRGGNFPRPFGFGAGGINGAAGRETLCRARQVPNNLVSVYNRGEIPVNGSAQVIIAAECGCVAATRGDLFCGERERALPLHIAR